MIDLSKDELARVGARSVYADLQARIKAIAAAYPDVVENYEDAPKEAKPRTRRRAPRTTTNSLVETLQSVMPAQAKVSAPELLALVKKTGFTFTRRDEMAELGRALREMADQKLVKRSGKARSTRYVLRKTA